MTLRAWIITLRGRIREALVPELALLREELGRQRTCIHALRIRIADQDRRINHLMLSREVRHD